MRDLINIICEAAPTDEMRARVFYHGTSDTASAEAILREGFRGRETQGRSHLAPVQGRVYFTPDIHYAIIYALGGDFSHAMLEGKDFSDPYGYVFIIRGSDLIDIQPDEDSVGKWLYDNAEAITIPWVNPQTRQVAMKPDGTPFTRTTGYRCAFPNGSVDERVWSFIRREMTDIQFKNSMDGFVGHQAAGGKRALKKMPDWVKIHLINAGAHIAHAGSIQPSECWKMLKRDLKLLKKDGSNFFSVAERIK